MNGNSNNDNNNNNNLGEYFERVKQQEETPTTEERQQHHADNTNDNNDEAAHKAPQQQRIVDNDDDEEDESNFRFFLSEPSISEEGTADSLVRERILSMLSPVRDNHEEEEDDYYPQPPPPEQSPGNTSLSSRETSSSQHGLKHMVQVYFSPEHRRKLKLPQLVPSPPPTTEEEEGHVSCEHTVQEKDEGVHNGLHATSKTAAAAAAKKKKSGTMLSRREEASAFSAVDSETANFLRDLKEHSVGALRDAKPEDDAFDSDQHVAADKHEVGAVMRAMTEEEEEQQQQRERISSADTDKVDNSVGSVVTAAAQEQQQHRAASAAAADETLIMTLSDTEDEDEVGTKDDTEATPLDWEQKHSADDEQTTNHSHKKSQQQRRRRWPFGRAFRGGHRRTRSGDAAAASLMTGGLDWKGMQVDQLPIPPSHDELDDEEDEETTLQGQYHRDPRKSNGAADHILGKRDWSKLGSVPSTHEENDEGSTEDKERQLSRRNGNGAVPWTRNDEEARDSRPEPNKRERSVGSNHRERNSSDSAPLRQTSSELTPDAFSLYALQSQEMLPVSSLSPLDGSFSSVDSYLPTRGGDSFGLPSAAVNRGGPVAGFGHNRRPSDINVSTRDSTFSWLSASERLPTAMQRSHFTSERPHTVLGESQSEASDHYDDDESDSYFSETEEEERGVMHNRMEYPAESIRVLPEAERLLESRDFRGNAQNVLRRPMISPFMSKVGPKTPLNNFMIESDNKQGFPTFVCPKCKTVQREFFTVATAPSKFESPAGYLALYFLIYVVSALYIFGLEEGWAPLDCVYFAVITLTTAGLGDLVPTSDSAKIICSIFIYFGVACIGLLLGTYLAGMMDDKSSQEAKKKQVENCTNCARLRHLRRMDKRKRSFMNISQASESHRPGLATVGGKRWISERHIDTHGTNGFHAAAMAPGGISQSMRVPHTPTQPGSLRSIAEHAPPGGPEENSEQVNESFFQTPTAPEDRKTLDHQNFEDVDGYRHSQQHPSPGSLLGSPMTTQILHRQRRTRHTSIGHDAPNLFFGAGTAVKPRKYSADIEPMTLTPAIPEGKPVEMSFEEDSWKDDEESSSAGLGEQGDEESTDESSTTSSYSEELNEMRMSDKVKTARYIFLTLKQALMNSILIIAIGGIGFYSIEKMTMVDAFYFTTVLLTTVGYGDIYPQTSAGKLFATIYVLVAGTVLLNNMSLISMIPLELRRRRLEKVVLTQFGDQLDDVALRELATGPLVRRLQLEHKPSTTGLDECTREMFALAMLVRLGKVSESDIRMTFAAFRRLDVDNDGVLSSKSIIAGLMAAKRRERCERAVPPPEQPPPPPTSGHAGAVIQNYWYGDRGSLHVETGSGEIRYQAIPISTHRRSFSHSPKYREIPSERSSLYGSETGYDSFPYDVEQGYADDESGYNRLSQSLQ